MAELIEDGDSLFSTDRLFTGSRFSSEEVWNVCLDYIERIYRRHRGVSQFRLEQLKQRLDKRIEIYQRHDTPIFLSRALRSRGVIALLANEDEQALSLFSDAIEIAEPSQGGVGQPSRHHPFVENPFAEWVDECIEYIGRIYCRRSEWRQAIEEFKRVHERKQARKNLAGISGLLNMIAETQLLAGETDDAERNFEQSWGLAQKTTSFGLIAMVLSTGISIALELENDTEAEERLHLFEEVTLDWNAGWIWHKRQMTHGILKMRDGATKDAKNLFSAGLDVAEKADDLGLIVQYRIHLAESNLRSGNLDQALHYANTALQTAREHNLWQLGDACLITARVKTQANEIDEVKTLIEQAIEHFQSKNLPHKIALAQDFLDKRLFET